jgi:hypothetical protein
VLYSQRERSLLEHGYDPFLLQRPGSLLRREDERHVVRTLFGTDVASADLSLQAVEANARVARLHREAIGPDGTAETGLAAVRLRRAGWEVVLLEARYIGAGSSSRSAAGIRQQVSTLETVLGMRYSVDVYRRFPEEVGGMVVPIVENGYLFLLDDPTELPRAAARVALAAWASRLTTHGGLSSPFAFAAISLSLRFCMADSACPGAPSSGSPKARPKVRIRVSTEPRNSPSHSERSTPARSAFRRARLSAFSAERRAASLGSGGRDFKSRRSQRGRGRGWPPPPGAWRDPACGYGRPCG